MKRKLLCILFLTISMFFIKDDVFAYINRTNTEIECVYANGVVIGLNHESSSTGSPKQTAYVKEYPIAKSVVIDGDPITNISLYNANHAAERLRELSCPREVHYWIAWKSNDSDNGSKSFYGVYSFDWCTNKASGCGGSDESITSALRSPLFSWWFSNTKGWTVDVTSKDLRADKQAQPDAIIPLVGERLYVVGDIADLSDESHGSEESKVYGRTYRIYNGDADGDGKEDSQAVGSRKYAQFYLGDATYDKIPDKYFLQVGDTITKFNDYGGDMTALDEYICIYESIVEEDASRGESGKKFTKVRHGVVNSTKTAKCESGGTKYVRTTETCKIQVGANTGESFCETYANTSLVLIDVVKIMQVLVPALTIILTGIEIGRIVVAGNLDEELPKRKKSMIIRLIIMVAFLFLPIITQLIINLAEGKDILNVSCLFNDGREPNQTLSEQNCDNAIDEDE